ncbi:unnamed protein product [Absidia cylindrospora]
MPATTTSLLSWGATLGVAASAAYVNRRNSQDDILTLNHKDDNSAINLVPSSPSSPPSHGHRDTYYTSSRNSDIHILTFVLGKD